MCTWTESSPEFSARCLLTNRAGLECCLQVGLNARPVAQMARELGVSWDTVMAAVTEHGEPLVADPDRVGKVTALGVESVPKVSLLVVVLSFDREHVEGRERRLLRPFHPRDEFLKVVVEVMTLASLDERLVVLDLVN